MTIVLLRVLTIAFIVVYGTMRWWRTLEGFNLMLAALGTLLITIAATQLCGIIILSLVYLQRLNWLGKKEP